MYSIDYYRQFVYNLLFFCFYVRTYYHFNYFVKNDGAYTFNGLSEATVLCNIKWRKTRKEQDSLCCDKKSDNMIVARQMKM